MVKASLGFYDAHSKLTFIVKQHGRLLFNMGVKGYKALDRSCIRRSIQSLGQGDYVGLALYPEEVFYLMRQRAIQIKEIFFETGSCAENYLSIEDFYEIIKSCPIILACATVYARIKEKKLHLKRCSSTFHEAESKMCLQDCRDPMSELVLFDVFKNWKSTDAKDDLQTKHMELVFRLAVFRVEDDFDIDAMTKGLKNHRSVPLKVAVVDGDTVLFLELNG